MTTKTKIVCPRCEEPLKYAKDKCKACHRYEKSKARVSRKRTYD